MKKVSTDDVILQFSDDAGIVHEISLSNILDGGIPIDEESGDDMEFLCVKVIDWYNSPIT